MNDSKKEKFASIYTEYYERLLRYAYFRVSNLAVAEELVQETFLKTWEYMNKTDKEVLDFKNFLYRVIKNLIIDFYKQKTKKELSIEEVNQRELQIILKLEDVIDNKLKHKKIIDSIYKLEKKYKDVIVYRYIEEQSIEDICQRTGLSPNYVSVIIYKGMTILKNEVRETVMA